jgi:hypothetical protein
MCHPALDAGSPEKRALSFRGLRVKSAMTSTPQGAFETAVLYLFLTKFMNHQTGT